MTTRETAKKLIPDAGFVIGFHEVLVDDYFFVSWPINWFLRKIGSRKRARIVLHEDAVRASGIWTPEKAAEVADRLIIGKDGNFMDPQKWTIRKFLRRIFQKK